MAHRVAEAVRRGSAVLVADVGRPNRKAFMTQLRDLLPEVEIGSDFTTEGMAIQETDGPPSPSREVPVQLLELPMNGPASQTVRAAARSIRPNKVGASSLVESTCWEVGVESLST
ncbi:Pentatricopeptide repeat-containing protein [Durusdinium trenchii]